MPLSSSKTKIGAKWWWEAVPNPHFAAKFTAVKGEKPVERASSSAPVPVGGKPRGPRLACRLEVRCQTEDREFPAVVKNISARGFGLESREVLKKGQLLQVDGLPCRVRWARRMAPPNEERRLAGLEIQAEPSLLSQSWMASIIQTLVELENRNTNGTSTQQLPLEIVGSLAGEEVAVPGYAAILRPPPPEPVAETPELPLELPLVPELTAEPEPPPSSPTPDPDLQAFASLLEETQKLRAPQNGFFSRALRELRSFAFHDRASVLERRRVGRLVGDLPLHVHLGKEVYPAWLLDASPVGIGMQLARPLNRGARVQIEPRESGQGNSLEAVVRYCRRKDANFRVGLALGSEPLDGTWLFSLLRDLGFQRRHLEQTRQYVRAPAGLPVEVRSWRGDFVLSQFVDLSRGGALLRSVVGWPAGEHLRLVLGPLGSLPVIYFAGVVLQQREEADGHSLMRMRFDEMDPAQLSKLDQYIVALLEAQSRP